MSIKVVQLTKNSDFQKFVQVARMHMDRIHHGILPLFGLKMLAKVYHHLAEATGAKVWVAMENEEICGFITGTLNTKETFLDLLKSPALILQAFLSGFYFSPKVLVKLPALVIYPLNVGKRSAEIGESTKIELLSIAVAENMGGKGVGKLLVAELEKWLRQVGASRYRVTTNVEEVVSNSFYIKLGFSPYRRVSHHKLILQVYEKNISPEVSV